MSAPDMADLFGESDEDEFTPAERMQNNVTAVLDDRSDDGTPCEQQFQYFVWNGIMLDALIKLLLLALKIP